MLYCGPDTCHVTALTGLLVACIHDDTGFWSADLKSEHALSIEQHRDRLPFCTRVLGPAIGESDVSRKPDSLNGHGGIVWLAREDGKQPRDLDYMLEATHGLHCADARDKVYATLSTLSTDVAQRISVDYTMTAFELLEDKSFDKLLRLFKLLDVQSADPAFLAAVAARSGTLICRNSQRLPAARPLSSIELTDWKGSQLQKSGSDWFLGDGIIDLEPISTLQNTAGVQNIDSRGVIAAVVPSIARPGDWLIQPHSARVQDAPALLIRGPIDGRYEILSTAVIATGAGLQGRFEVTFELEDLATLLLRHQLLPDKPPAGVEPSLVQHVHNGAANSNVLDFDRLELRYKYEDLSSSLVDSGDPSIALAKWEAAVKHRTEVEWQQHFSVKVCQQPGSSFAVEKAVHVENG
ncbi:hypothetical protein B0A48_09882 [Cryoendolithus antarcticus]|uniref:Uncharacterized protein n=1 Tax=Cryoendolithus antarcticus TaxID=1507870 RepID=A0A1V8T2Y8_9PEZI|nr:hypothetical protein B0A48_09882 [Cryoendolithus antarcticus]